MASAFRELPVKGRSTIPSPTDEKRWIGNRENRDDYHPSRR